MKQHNDNWDGVTRKPLNEAIGFPIRNPTIPTVIEYLKKSIKNHSTMKSDLEYAIDDLEIVQKALEEILKTGKFK
jgi:hypothetical protein